MDKRSYSFIYLYGGPTCRQACPVTPWLLIVSLQEVHDLLSDYELKYCFVDKYKGTGLWTVDRQGN